MCLSLCTPLKRAGGGGELPKAAESKAQGKGVSWLDRTTTLSPVCSQWTPCLPPEGFQRCTGNQAWPTGAPIPWLRMGGTLCWGWRGQRLSLALLK